MTSSIQLHLRRLGIEKKTLYQRLTDVDNAIESAITEALTNHGQTWGSIASSLDADAGSVYRWYYRRGGTARSKFKPGRPKR